MPEADFLADVHSAYEFLTEHEKAVPESAVDAYLALACFALHEILDRICDQHDHGE